MKLDGKLFLFGLPLLAIVAIALLQTKYGGLAPAPPMSLPDRTAHRVVPKVKVPEPTVLAPSAEVDLLPPGSENSKQFDDEWLDRDAQLDDNQIIEPAAPPPIPGLQPPANAIDLAPTVTQES